MKIVQVILLIGVFFILYSLLNFFMFSKFFSMLSIQKNYLIYIIPAGLSLFFIVSIALVRSYFNFFTRASYTISALWLGILLLLYSSLAVYYIIRIFWKIPPETAGVAILVAVSAITIFSIINAQLIYTKTVSIPEFPAKLRAVQLTDIHTGTVHNSPFIKRIVDKVNELQPEVVFITGDLISGESKVRPEMFYELKRLNAPTYFINGNHEYYEGLETVQEVLKETNITILKNEAVEFKGIEIIGIDYSQRKEDYNEAFSELRIPEGKPSIMLVHSPLRIEYPEVNLVLSGHTHAGQIYPFNIVHRIIAPYVKGLYKLGKGYIYISPGTGTWGPPMRLGSKNEITLLELG